MRSLQLFLGAWLAGTPWSAGADDSDGDSTALVPQVPGTRVAWSFLARRRRSAARPR